MKKKIHSLVKNKKCACGKQIRHNHFLCDDCWHEQKISNKLKKKAMKKKKWK